LQNPAEFIVAIEARCLTCGYRLLGLPEPICPECGRPFDPSDPATYDSDPRRRRRRRIAVRIAVGVMIVLLLFVFVPRRILRSNITFTCTKCGHVVTVSRWDPALARWTGIRYPGYVQRQDLPPAPDSSPDAVPSAPACAEHHFGVRVKFDLFIGGFVTGTAVPESGEVVAVNGMTATPETAPQLLRALTDPSNWGVTIGGQPASAVTSVATPVGPN
jgi:hypothetical protein